MAQPALYVCGVMVCKSAPTACSNAGQSRERAARR